MEALQAPLTTGSEISPYQPIDSDAGEIRLVELLPGGYDDPISLSLHTVKLEQRVTDEGSDENMSDLTNPNQEKSDDEHWYERPFHRKFEYEALSYAWGTAISPRRVLVDGIELHITESLDSGLRRLRFGDKPRTLWIDALCINQRDIEERSHQVQHMAMIYTSAKDVLIWLGEWPNNAACSHPDDCQALWFITLQEEGGEEGSESLPHVPLHIFQHFVDIMELPWFRRLWVVQELALARKDPIVLIGSLSTSWSSFSESVYDTLISDGLEGPDDVQLRVQFKNGWNRVSSLAEIRSRSGSHRGLYWCLIGSQKSISADPRDKVYGLLGLCKFQVTEAIAVDYSKSLWQVLVEATVVSILEESAFPYLNEYTGPTGCFDRKNWTKSSWVLDFTSVPTDVHLNDVPNSKLDVEERKKRRGSIHLSRDWQTLYAHGRYVGTVCETQRFSWSGGNHDMGFQTQRTNTETYDFYHNILKPRGISPRTLLQAIRRKRTINTGTLRRFTSFLLGSRDDFRSDFTLNLLYDFGGNTYSGHLGGRDIVVTEEGDIGISLHRDCRPIPNGAILVCLFGTEVPFILAPIPETELHEMINIAYVPGYGDKMLDRYYPIRHRATWIDFAAEGGKEYAIV